MLVELTEIYETDPQDGKPTYTGRPISLNWDDVIEVGELPALREQVLAGEALLLNDLEPYEPYTVLTLKGGTTHLIQGPPSIVVERLRDWQRFVR